MATKKNACELCGLPDDSYTIEENGKVFHVCKLCHDGFVETSGEQPADVMVPDDFGLDALKEVPQSGGDGKVATLSPEEMEKLLRPSSAERRRLYASLKKAAKSEKELLASDTESLKSELVVEKEAIEEERRLQAQIREKAMQAAQSAAVEPNGDALGGKIDNATEEAMSKLMGIKSPSEKDQDEIENNIKAQRAEEKRIAQREKAQREANPTIDDDRITITSPEVELEKDSRPKTNFDAATAEYVGSVRFYEAFKFVMHPVVYAIFAGLVVLAVATVFMITLTWKESLIDLFAGAGAVAVGFLLVWYMKRRFVTDKRTVLLRIRQEQIAFQSIVTPCYRELKTKYPIIKALGWLLTRLSVIVPVLVIVGGTIAAVVFSFLQFWWLLGPVMVAATVGATLMYYILKFWADFVSYKLDAERNQQIIEQTLLDLLSKKK
ncbi:MAG: hypothetical protein HDT28_02865 [Clostridiales bacterium]|nr:hypothetical protein [Clostridiales bacterium]